MFSGYKSNYINLLYASIEITHGGCGIFADLNSVEIYRNRISLGGRQPENERKYRIRHWRA